MRISRSQDFTKRSLLARMKISESIITPCQRCTMRSKDWGVFRETAITGRRLVKEMSKKITNSPFENINFNEFRRKHKKKQEQVTVQQIPKNQTARPSTPAIPVAPVKKQAAKVTNPP